MLRYNIAKLVKGRRKGTSAQLPQIHGTVRAEQDYLKACRSMLRQLARAVRKDLLPQIERELKAQRAPNRVVGDVRPEDFESLSRLSGALTRMTTRTVMRILGLEAQRHTAQFMQTAKRALGVDLSAVVRADDLEEYMETVTTRNAGLIKNLSEDAINRVQVTVTNAVTNGQTVAELKKQLVADFGFADRRAKRIARDQTAKFNSELNQIRQTQAGIIKYHWRTSHDERVRPLHRKLDGKEYQYGKPTGAEQGLPPGRPILCRCIAQAIVEF